MLLPASGRIRRCNATGIGPHALYTRVRYCRLLPVLYARFLQQEAAARRLRALEAENDVHTRRRAQFVGWTLPRDSALDKSCSPRSYARAKALAGAERWIIPGGDRER